MTKLQDIANIDLLNKIRSFYNPNHTFTQDGKASTGAEAERMLYVNEAHRRGLIGMKSKRKYRRV